MTQAGRTRTVSAELTFDVHEPSTLAIHVRPATTAGHIRHERFHVGREDHDLVPASQLVPAEHGGRIDLVSVMPGRTAISYFAEFVAASGATGAPVGAVPVLEQLVYLRPSRYCPSDRIVAFVLAELGAEPCARTRVSAVATWIFERISYLAGASVVHDSADDTLLTGRGVCRDFAHLGIAMCRALGIPARFVAGYAPGLDPMDFHALFEAWHDGAWWSYDATRKAPRDTLVRVATGRDAADASFATVIRGVADLVQLTVTATSDGDLPRDRHDAPLPVA